MATTCALNVLKGASTSTDPSYAAEELFRAINQPDISLALFYCSPEYDLVELGRELKRLFQDTCLIGCTTAGEITPEGYLRGSLTGVSISGDDFKVLTQRFDNVSTYATSEVDQQARQLIQNMADLGTQPRRDNTFGYLLIDGLCMKEELVVSALYRGLGDVSIFGGSAGDGTRFEETHIYADGAFRQDCAVCCLVQTSRPFTVFRTQHFVPSEEKMVVTEADPARRIVTEINGGPAAREYASALGVCPTG